MWAAFLVDVSLTKINIKERQLAAESASLDVGRFQRRDQVHAAQSITASIKV